MNAFYCCNWMHDRLYEFGFTEAAKNFLQTNFSRGGLGGDPVVAYAQFGAGAGVYYGGQFYEESEGTSGEMADQTRRTCMKHSIWLRAALSGPLEPVLGAAMRDSIVPSGLIWISYSITRR